MMMNWKRMGALTLAIYGLMGLMPLFFGGVDHIMHILIMCLIWSVVASCWDLIMGFAGIFSFGPGGFSGDRSLRFGHHFPRIRCKPDAVHSGGRLWSPEFSACWWGCLACG